MENHEVANPRLSSVDDLAGRVIKKVEQVQPNVIRFYFQDSWTEVRAVDEGATLGWDDSYHPDETGDIENWNTFVEVVGKTIRRADFTTYVGTAKTLKYFHIFFTDGGDMTLLSNYFPMSDMTLEPPI